MIRTEAESPPVTAVGLDRSHSLYGQHAIQIVRDGESVFFHTNEFGSCPEIGVWRHSIPSSTFQDLVVRLDGLSRAVPEDGPMMPGQMVTTFEVTRAGEAEPRRLSFHPDQPELREVLDQVSMIEAELREYPSRVLRGEAHWRNEVVGKDDTVMLDITLSNPGSQRIQIENPALEVAKGYSGFRLWIRFEEGGGTTVDVSAKDIQAIDAWAVTPELLLAPGQQVSFAVRTSLSAIDPGRCETGLDIRSDRTENATREFLSGKLSIDLGTITVTE